MPTYQIRQEVRSAHLLFADDPDLDRYPYPGR